MLVFRFSIIFLLMGFFKTLYEGSDVRRKKRIAGSFHA